MLSRRCFLAQASMAAAANWPEFRGHGDSLGGTSHPPLTWGPSKNVAWKSATPGYGQSSPAIWGDRVFLTSIDGAEKETLHVFCLNLRSGSELWSGRLAGECWTSPVGIGERIYYFAVTGVTEVYSAEAQPKKLAENSLDEMERTYGVAVVDDGFVLRSGRRVVRVQES